MKSPKYPNLLAEMARRGETQKSLAEILGLSVNCISQKMNGKTEWNIGEIEKLCEHYGKDYYELFK